MWAGSSSLESALLPAGGEREKWVCGRKGLKREKRSVEWWTRQR